MKLLIAYDGTEGATAAIDDLQVAGLPQVAQASVVTVADVWPGLLGPPPKDVNVALVRRARKRAEELLVHAEETARNGADRVTQLFPAWQVGASAVADSPHWAFVKQAEELDADLVVVGSRGRTLAKRLTLGSVSQVVVNNAPCSVRIARPSGRAGGSAPIRLLVGFDGSTGAAEVITALRRRVWPRGTEVRMLTVIDERTQFFMVTQEASTRLPSIGPDEDARTYLSRAMEQAADVLREGGLIVTTDVKRGDPKRVLVNEARTGKADCIFLGARGLSRAERILLGSVSSSVAARAQCSVEIVRARSM